MTGVFVIFGGVEGSLAALPPAIPPHHISIKKAVIQSESAVWRRSDESLDCRNYRSEITSIANNKGILLVFIIVFSVNCN